jgi:hypothetical protein
MSKVLLKNSFGIIFLLILITFISGLNIKPENYPVTIHPNETKDIVFRVCPTLDEPLNYNRLTFGIQFTKIDKEGNIWYYPQGSLGMGFPRAIFINNETCSDVPLTLKAPPNYTAATFRVKLLPMIRYDNGSYRPLYNQTEAIKIKINETPNGFETIKNQSSIGVVNPKYDYAKIFIAAIVIIIIVICHVDVDIAMKLYL